MNSGTYQLSVAACGIGENAVQLRNLRTNNYEQQGQCSTPAESVQLDLQILDVETRAVVVAPVSQHSVKHAAFGMDAAIPPNQSQRCGASILPLPVLVQPPQSCDAWPECCSTATPLRGQRSLQLCSCSNQPGERLEY